MSSASLRYDKFSYAVKRKPERETPSPTGTPKSPGSPGNKSGPHALALTRDGFAISEDGSLMSRVVSPPRASFGPAGAVGFASSNPTVVPVTPARLAAPFNSPASTHKGGSSAAAKRADPWGALIHAAAGKLSEDDVVMLSWDTVADLLEHFGITNPIDVGRVQLTWRRKQELALGNDVLSDCSTRDAQSAGGARTGRADGPGG
jgi:hypothetical protein